MAEPRSGDEGSDREGEPAKDPAPIGDEGDRENGSSEHDHDSSKPEDDHVLTDEDILRREAAQWLQRTVRGHAVRRRTLWTPVWVLSPTRVLAESWGYQTMFDALDIERAKERHGFTEQVGLLDAVLEEGLGALPHLFKKELGRPMVRRRTRTSYLKSLVEFCLDMGDAYARWGQGGPAEFMWQSAETLCTLPPCEDTNANRTLDACNFKGKLNYLVRHLRCFTDPGRLAWC
jgi:hypothetical protein